ncbi:MAG: ABC transporter permease [Burkholderiaceae bacterium]
MARLMHHLANIRRLGVKELWSLWRDPTMLFLIVWTFTVAIYTAGTSMPETLQQTPVAIVDEDDSALSARIFTAFYPPSFNPPVRISQAEVDPVLDAGRYTLVLVIPPDFQRDVLAGLQPTVQLNVDATRMSQAFVGSGLAGQIVMGEVGEFLQGNREVAPQPVELVTRMRFNPTLSNVWFGSLMELVAQVTMASIILTGAALIREREHGTVEHLLVMPVTPTEIMLAKVWAMGLVVLAAAVLSMHGVIRWLLQVPIEGSLWLFFFGAGLHLFATTSMGIFMATLARNMPQFGLLVMLVMMPLQMLSGGMTPRESMPSWVQWLMSLAPTTHFTELSQAVLYRGAGIEVVWTSLVALGLIGAVLFGLSLRWFRRAIMQMA